MRYVFDNNSLSSIFKFYFSSRFPSFWDKFNNLVSKNEVVSVREVRRELEKKADIWSSIKEWLINYPDFFSIPTEAEMLFISEIFKVKHFQQMIRRKNILNGEPVADPFIIARAKVYEATVVTEEGFKKNATKIPNICQYFHIECIRLEQFLEKEEWQF